MRRYDHIMAHVRRGPWAIWAESPEWASILDVLAMRRRGETLADDEIAERVAIVRAARGERRGARAVSGVAVVPLYGPIMPRADAMTEMSGATSVQGFLADVRAAADDPDVGTIVIDVDSPGGLVSLIPEAAAELRAIRDRKPVVAVADTMAASAAYHLASQATELVASPSSLVGSIGVVTLHEDWSGWYDQQGIRPTLISAGQYKTEGNEYEPLSEEARAAIQAEVDHYYDLFARDVAKGRGVKVADVRSGYGKGRVLPASKALEEGLVDRIGTLEETLARVQARPPAPGRAKALGPMMKTEAQGLLRIPDGTESITESSIASVAVGDPEPAHAEPAPDESFAFERELYALRAVRR